MKEILVYLNAIYGVAKDLHYTADGKSFYGLHLMYDEIADGLLDNVDEIKENYYLANDEIPPTSKEIFELSLSMMSGESDILELHNLLDLCIHHIDEVVNKKINLSEGVKSLLGDISNSLSKKIAFVNRTIIQH